MRSSPMARRIAASALGLALAATVAACSSSGSSSTTSSSTTSSTPASASASATASGATSGSAAVAQITANWEKFFDASTPIAEKVTLLQNGTVFQPAIKAFAVIILGGLGSVKGAVVGGLVYGVVESFATFFLGGSWRDAVAFVVLIVVLVLRPEGIFREGS